MARRLKAERHRLKDLRDVLLKEQVSTPEKTKQLALELAEHYQDPIFAKCTSMGQIIDRSLKKALVSR